MRKIALVIGFAALITQIAGAHSIGVVVAVVIIHAPWLVADRSMAMTTRAPAKEIDPSVVGLRDVTVGTANVGILAWCETPSVGRGLILKMSLGELHPLGSTH